MSNLTVQDIVSQGQDYVSNYTTGAVDQGNWLRGVNRAIEYLKRYMGLPSDENIFRFYFYEDTMTYNLPVDFNEGDRVFFPFGAGQLLEIEGHNEYLFLMAHEIIGVVEPAKLKAV